MADWDFVLGAMMLLANARFSRFIRRAPRCRDREVLALAQACATEFGLRRPIEVVETALVDSPAMFGLFRCCLLLPEGLIGRLNAEELRLVFLHEFAHVRRADIPCSAVLLGLQILHWFNPILWLAFARMRHDREMATDALVLSGERSSLKTLYGQTLLK